MSFPVQTAEFLILLGALSLPFDGIVRIIQGAKKRYFRLI